MSEFFKRWLARKHQAIQQQERSAPEAVALLDDETAGERSVPTGDSGVVTADQRGGEPHVSEAGDQGAQAKVLPGKPGLPDKETLRAIFRTHQPDGLDDYTQDFSKPELLPAALTAGLRSWLVEQVTSPDAEVVSQPSTAIKEVAFAADQPDGEATKLSDSSAQDLAKSRDILVAEGGQNVPEKEGGREDIGF